MGMNILKKKRIRLVIFLLVFALFFIFNKETYAKSYSVENMQISANILENGDLQVNQKIEYKFNGAYNGIYIDVPCNLDDEKYNKARKQNTIFLIFIAVTWDVIKIHFCPLACSILLCT